SRDRVGGWRGERTDLGRFLRRLDPPHREGVRRREVEAAGHRRSRRAAGCQRLSQAAAAAQESQKAGRGFLFITAAKLYFMVAGAMIEFVLPHLFPADGRARLFGLYKVTVGIVSVINNVMITVTIQSVSKFVAEDDTRQGQVARAGFRLMALIGIVTAGTFAAAAPLPARCGDG